MRVRIFNRLDLVNPLQTEIISLDKPLTITEILSTGGISGDLSKLQSLDIYSDGNRIPFVLWDKMKLSVDSDLRIIINPKEPATVIGVIMIIISVAMSVFSMIMAKKIKAKENKNSSTSSIYDPNAQGNKVHLEDPVPEQFGYVKAFPDLISEYHYYYKNNVRYMDVLLCQGMGYYDWSAENVYIGNTPITDYGANLYKLNIYNPSEDISDHSAHKCWFNSTEVTSSGQEISPLQDGESEEDTDTKDTLAKFGGTTIDTFVQSYIVTGVTSSGLIGYESLTEKALNYEVDNIFKLSNCDPFTDLILRGETVYPDSNSFNLATDLDYVVQESNGLKIYLDYLPFDATEFTDNIKKLKFVYRVEYVITPMGSSQTIPVHGETGNYSYTLDSDDVGKYVLLSGLNVDATYQGSSGSSFHATFSVLAEKCHCPMDLLKVDEAEDESAYITDTNELFVGATTILNATQVNDLAVGDVVTISRQYVFNVRYSGNYGWTQTTYTINKTHLFEITSISDVLGDVYLRFDRYWDDISAFDVPTMGYNQTVTVKSCSLYMTREASFDYPNRDGNGYYRVVSVDDSNTMTIQAVTEDSFEFEDNTDWTGFPFSGLYSCDFKLVSGANADTENANKRTTVGPYRACPRGTGARYYEVDIRFPNGLYTMSDSGEYEDRTASIRIEFRAVGTSQWNYVEKTYTYATGNELGFTYSFDMAEYDGITDENEYLAYEFKVTNTSEYSDDTKVQQKVYWNGLKCLISEDTSYDDVTVLALSIKGDETMSEANENQIATYWTRKLPNINTGTLETTKQIVPVIKYICDQSRFNDLYNLSSWTSYADLVNGAGIEFNYRFDEFTTILEAIRTVLQIGYAEPTINGNEIIPIRRYKTDSFVQMFSPQNMIGAPRLSLNLITEETDNELDISYMDGDSGNGTWKETQFFTELDVNSNTGSTSYYQQSQNNQQLELLPCTSEDQAYKLAIRQLREMMYSRQEISFKTELEGLNCAYGDVILVALPMDASLISGRVTAYDSENNIITVDQVINSESVTGVIYIRRYDGSVWGGTCAYLNESQIQLVDYLDWDIYDFEDSQLEQPFFCFGNVFKGWVKSVKPNDRNEVTITATNYDDRIFTDDIFSGYGISPYGTCAYGSY